MSIQSHWEMDSSGEQPPAKGETKQTTPQKACLLFTLPWRVVIARPLLPTERLPAREKYVKILFLQKP